MNLKISPAKRKKAFLPLLFVSISPFFHSAAFGQEIVVSPSAAKEIGQLIWKNECAGTELGLTSWNDGEYFASLGIGHFIWYPEGVRGPFEESFPSLIKFITERDGRPPAWVLEAVKTGCPWPDRKSFFAEMNGQKLKELRAFLMRTVPLQAEFIVRRFQRGIPKILEAAPASERAKLRERIEAVASTPIGVYALVDYTNFKGEGISPTERYQGKGWGLLQVLQAMRDTRPANADFSDAARRMLQQRVKNSPPERNEARWMPGWSSRVATYAGK